MRISRFICALIWISLSLIQPIRAQNSEGTKKEAKTPLLYGIAVMVDLAGPVMKALDTKFNQLECGARVNFRDKYFPIAELGIGECTRDGESNSNHFSTQAPYFRVGMDYNFNKKGNVNRFFAGLRYGFSSFNFDFENPDFQDPVYGGQQGLMLKDVEGKMHWTELCLGCETKLWNFVRLGWTFRFKMRLSQKGNDMGDPYYVPGFGKNGTTTWGGTCNLIFDVGRKFNKRKDTIKITEKI